MNFYQTTAIGTKFLAISDKNTFGLTGAISGDYHDDLVNSNFHKLVLE